MSKKQAILAAVTVLVSAGPALAADKWQPAPSVKDEPVYEQRSRWDGFYLGVNGGYAFGDTQNASFDINDDRGSAGSLSLEGAFGGGQIGYNAVFGRVLVGVEADLQGADIDDRSSRGGRFAAADVNYFGTVRGRLGFVADRALIYATGGYAYADVDIDMGVPGTRLSGGDMLDGYAVGGGLEYALSDRWSMKAEYQYVDLESVTAVGFDGGDRFATKIDPDFHTVRLGLNYRF